MSTRMDNNIFLRATQGMLPPSDATSQNEFSARFDRSDLRAFARFLGERQLVKNFRWGISGLTLYLPGVKSPLMTTRNQIFPTVKNNSSLTLEWDGSVEARCGKIDAAGLEVLRSDSIFDPVQLENQVALAVAQAWRNFRDRKILDTERAIGQVPDTDIFIVPPTRTPAQFWRRVVVGVMLTISLLLMAMVWLFPERFSGMKPVNLTETQVHEFMSLVSTNPNPMIKTGDGAYTQNGFAYDPRNALLGFACYVLPETNLFTLRGLDAIHSTILGTSDLDAWRQNPKRLQLFMNSQYHRAIYEGWLSWQELNLKPADCEAFLHTNRSSIYAGALLGLGSNWNLFLSRCDAWSWVKSQHYDVMRIQNWGVWDLRFLSEVNSLDLVDREKLIQQIASVQTLSANPPGNPPIHDWRDIRGLFFTPCFPALQDTCNSLAALEFLGGLNKIDREACIEGILKRHAGKGYFTSPDSGSYNEYHIDGSARDTIAAFESLRILGALDRVKDLDQWKFRVASYNSSKPDANGVRILTWDEIEAWVAQQRLGKILQARKEHPSAPVCSLLESF